jgi:FkbM family methyltransferase
MLDKYIKVIDKVIKKITNNATSEAPNLCVSGRFPILLPANHLLPIYKQQHALYDKFLPDLVKFFKKGDVVVDVGANCGDTLAAMVSANPTLSYICIEPDDDFYGYLEHNTSIIKKTCPEARISLVKSLISDLEFTTGLTGVGGTKHRDDAIVANDGAIKSRKLADILDEFDIGMNLRLIKSDVDGYDYEVINSAGKWLESSKTMLFFECQYSDRTQRNGFIRLLEELLYLGFSDFWFFDNFGGFLLNSKDSHIHKQLMDYVWRQNQEIYSRTVYYFDILASKPNDYELITKIVNQYREEK